MYRPAAFSATEVVTTGRVEDRITFLYLDMCRVERDDFGVHFLEAADGGSRVDVPVAGVSTLLLGPGTSITSPAAAMVLANGCSIILVGAAGTAYRGMLPSGSHSSRWLEVQAAAWADQDARLAVARRMYLHRFPEVPAGGLDQVPLTALRGKGLFAEPGPDVPGSLPGLWDPEVRRVPSGRNYS